jgi:hypothetical protein
VILRNATVCVAKSKSTICGFEGRVIALGPGADFSFKLGNLPVAGSLKYFHEFDVENRLEGDAGYVNFVIPLSGGAH